MQQHHLSSRSPTRDGGGRSSMTRTCVMVSMCTMARSPVVPLPMRSSCLTRQPIRHCTFPPMRPSNNASLCRGAECLLLAQSGHHKRADPCPLLGVKRTLIGDDAMSAFDPKETSADLQPSTELDREVSLLAAILLALFEQLGRAYPLAAYLQPHSPAIAMMGAWA